MMTKLTDTLGELILKQWLKEAGPCDVLRQIAEAIDAEADGADAWKRLASELATVADEYESEI